jgi:hypothetical protein
MKFLKWIGILLGIVLVIGLIFFLIFNKKEPVGTKGAAAEALTQKMFTAIDKTAWDSTNYVQWTFAGMNHYLWDKAEHLVEIKWGDKKVILNPNEISGKAFKNNVLQEGPAADKLVQKAWSNFCNDSFWLNAPAKAMDSGTERSIVKLDDGSEALKVSYSSGGVTPGDSYLWILDNNGLPTSWKMWTKIIPIGGVEFGWNDWKETSTGAMISTLHKGVFNLKIENVKTGQTLAEMGINENPFN